MTESDGSRHIEIKDGDQTVAAAEISTAQGAEGTARTSLHAAPGHIRPGRRAELVDAVLDSAEVQASTRLEATVPAGDGESLDRLREQTEDTITRPAGSSLLVDADLPAPVQPPGEPEPASPPAEP